MVLLNKSPSAYGNLVDRLLASPRFGERMASIWLDLSRYADSYGYQSDLLRMGNLVVLLSSEMRGVRL